MTRTIDAWAKKGRLLPECFKFQVACDPVEHWEIGQRLLGEHWGNTGGNLGHTSGQRIPLQPSTPLSACGPHDLMCCRGYGLLCAPLGITLASLEPLEHKGAGGRGCQAANHWNPSIACLDWGYLGVRSSIGKSF